MKLRLIILFTLSSLLATAQVNINHYIQVGRTRISTGNFVGAIENFNIVIKFKPQLPEPYFFRGVAKQQLEDYRGAIADYDKAVDIKPYFPDAYINRGLAHLALNEYADAVSDYDKALDLSPRNAAIYNNRGIAKVSMKDIDGAIADYDKALEANPGFVNALINRSNANIAKGDVLEAIRDLNKAIIIRPHFASAYLLRGLARFELNDFASALRDFDQTIKLDPQNAYAFNNRGIVKQRLEDFQGAIMDYDLALQLDPTMPNAYYNRGIAKEVLGKPGYEEDYRIAAKLDPKLNIKRQPTEEEYWAQVQQQKQQQQQQKNQSQSQSQNAGQSANKQSGTQAQQTAANQQTATADSTKNEEAEKARRRFRMALADTRNIPRTSEDEEEPGLIQNKTVEIHLQGIFKIASFSENTINYDRLQYYSVALEELNKFNNYTPQLTITNLDANDFTDSYQSNYQYFEQRLKAAKVAENYLCRGIFSSLLHQYNDALDDFNQALKLDSKSMMSYFSRANCRVKMVELLESVPDLSQDISVPIGNTQQKPVEKKEFLTDYNDILRDYQTCNKLDAKFPFAWYNQGYVLCKLGRYEEAVKCFDKAIEFQPDFAEAYYNRGLTQIYLDHINTGALDLSKAGELGIEDAYNVIKRYCN